MVPTVCDVVVDSVKYADVVLRLLFSLALQGSANSSARVTGQMHICSACCAGSATTGAWIKIHVCIQPGYLRFYFTL